MGERDGIARTLAVALGVALVCSFMVSAAVYWLRPMQLAYAEIGRNRAILEAAGLIGRDETVADREVAARFVTLEPLLFDTQTATFTTAVDARTYDYRAAADDTDTSSAVPDARNTAGVARIARYLPLYRSSDPERVVLPIQGRGMWSTIYGYLALEGDLATVAGVGFYEHGETPGIGDRIEDPAWREGWRGRRAIGADGTVVLDIDGITGATVTASAVERLARFWLGPDGYGPALARLAEAAPR